MAADERAAAPAESLPDANDLSLGRADVRNQRPRAKDRRDRPQMLFKRPDGRGEDHQIAPAGRFDGVQIGRVDTPVFPGQAQACFAPPDTGDRCARKPPTNRQADRTAQQTDADDRNVLNANRRHGIVA